MPTTIKVLVVDDSALIRQMLTRALAMDPRVEVVGSAKTGVEAIEKAKELEPDVITLDIEMPELSGLEALPHIRKHTRARVVMLSSLDDPDTTYRALALGAVDFIPKPSAGVASSITELSETLLKTIKTAYRIGERRIELPPMADIPRTPASDTAVRGKGNIDALVAIAASTGGPPALERVFAGLAPSLSAAYVIVQHLPAGFAASLAKRLQAVNEIPVSIAEDNGRIEPGCAYIAPYGSHLVVERLGDLLMTRLSDLPAVHGVRPAADLLFGSVAQACGKRAIGVVLTGMGADGAQGALAIKRAGGETVVQDEATSIVWGMPGAAMRLGAASRVVPIGLVAAEVRRAVRSKSESGVA